MLVSLLLNTSFILPLPYELKVDNKIIFTSVICATFDTFEVPSYPSLEREIRPGFVYYDDMYYVLLEASHLWEISEQMFDVLLLDGASITI